MISGVSLPGVSLVATDLTALLVFAFGFTKG